MKQIMIVLGILLFGFQPAHAQWRTYTTADGLAGNTVRTVIPDGKGGIWAACRFGGGVSHFDGSTWKSWTKTDGSLPDDDPMSLAVDHTGILWAGTGANHLMRFDGAAWEMLYNSPIQIHNIVVDNDNVKWLATYEHGLARYDDTTMTVYTAQNSELKDNVPIGMALDLNGALWIGYYRNYGVTKIQNGVWTYYNPSGIQPIYSVYGMCISPDNSVWMAGDIPEQGIWRMDQGGAVEYYPQENLVNGACYDIKVDHDNVVWVASAGGVSSFDGKNWRHYTKENSGLLSNVVVSIAVDENNVKWFATYDGGVSSFDYQVGPHAFLISPNGGEIIEAGAAFDITWSARGINRVSIEFSTDGGNTWSMVAASVDAAAGRYAWVAPSIQSDSCRVRITDADDPEHSDISFRAFTISPPFVRILSPNGGERWVAGTEQTIRWEGVGINSLRLEYSVDGGISWKTLSEAVAFSPNAYPWGVPESISSSCLVRATDESNGGLTDRSDDPFLVVAKYLTVLHPNGGEEEISNDRVWIDWSSEGVNTVDIEYSVDGGLSWKGITRKLPAGNASYSWYPGGMETRLCLVRITDSSDRNLFDASDTTFSLHVITGVSEKEPNEFRVFKNFPNPFNSSTTISFTIPAAGHVTVEIFTVSGQKVETLADGYLAAGPHRFTWDAARYSAGLYLYRISTPARQRTEKMLYLK